MNRLPFLKFRIKITKLAHSLNLTFATFLKLKILRLTHATDIRAVNFIDKRPTTSFSNVINRNSIRSILTQKRSSVNYQHPSHRHTPSDTLIGNPKEVTSEQYPHSSRVDNASLNYSQFLTQQIANNSRENSNSSHSYREKGKIEGLQSPRNFMLHFSRAFRISPAINECLGLYVSL